MTRSKLLEQIKVVGDGTSAFAKGTAETLVLVTTGSNKKLQTCDTSSGTFADFATLVDGTNNINIAGAKECGISGTVFHADADALREDLRKAGVQI